MIPSWDKEGLLPPYNIDGPNAGSPFRATPSEVVSRFGCTHHRLDLIEGLLDYCSLLYENGIYDGVQWVDGSFVQDKEPSDIDVTTFFRATNLPLRDNDLPYSQRMKKRFNTDATLINLADFDITAQLRTAAYWNSVWSHTYPGFRRKGYIQVQLSQQLDAQAKKALLDKRKALG